MPTERIQQAALDGTSWLELLRNPQSRWERSALYFHYPHYYPTTTPVSAIRDGDWKLLHYYESDRDELYNLSDDIGEQNNLLAEHPDVVARLKQRGLSFAPTTTTRARHVARPILRRVESRGRRR